jgi:hypothetical protein
MNRTKEVLIQLRWGVRIVMGFGICASITGNALHANLNPISIGISVVPPIVLALAFEMVSRVPISGTVSWYRKLPRPVATAAIAGMAATLSFRDQYDMILRYSRGDRWAAILLPLCIDGLLVVASVTVYELTLKIDALLAHEQGAAIRIAKPKDPDAVPPAPKTHELTAKERIAEIWTKAPTLTVKDIAGAAGVSYNYAHSVVKKLKELDSLEDLDAVPA